MMLKPFWIQLNTGIDWPPHLQPREKPTRYEGDCRVMSSKIGALCGGGRLTGLTAAPGFSFGLFRLRRAGSTPMRVSSRQMESSRALTMLDEAFERPIPSA